MTSENPSLTGKGRPPHLNVPRLLVWPGFLSDPDREAIIFYHAEDPISCGNLTPCAVSLKVFLPCDGGVNLATQWRFNRIFMASPLSFDWGSACGSENLGVELPPGRHWRYMERQVLGASWEEAAWQGYEEAVGMERVLSELIRERKRKIESKGVEWLLERALAGPLVPQREVLSYER